MQPWRHILVGLLTLLASTAVVRAQEPNVYLVTIGPGAEVYERFGHNAIWIRDVRTGLDVAYNYGVFSFDEGFIGRFIQGKLWYQMQATPGEPMVQFYKDADRAVWVQELNLSAQQKDQLRRLLAWNDRPENREYRYDYYLDNCSTRVRDVIDRAVGGQIKAQTQASDGRSFRWHTRRLTADDVPLYTALMAVLGPAIDRPITQWEEMFLPVRMREYLTKVTLKTESGEAVSLVSGESVIHQSQSYAELAQPPNYLPGYLTAGGLLGAIFVLSRRYVPTSRLARGVFAVLCVGWGLLIGVGGSILIWGWGFTDHVVTRWNENVLQVTPIALPMVVLGPLMALGRKRAVRAARWVSLALAVGSLAGFLLQILPGLDQHNGEIIALVLPTNLGLAWAVWRWTGPKNPSDQAAGTKKHRESDAASPAPKNGERNRHEARLMVLGLALAMGLGGCGQKPKTQKVMPAVPTPPAVPPVKAQQADSELRWAAGREIAAALASPDEIIRAHAMEAARDGLGISGAQEILAGLRDSSALVRFAAAMAAGEVRLKEAQGVLLKMVQDSSPNVRVAVRFALHRLGETRYSHDLEKSAQAKSPVVRGNTAMALGLLGEKSAMKVLAAMRRDPQPAVRLQVAEAMWHLGDETARDILIAATISPYPDDQMVGLLALAGHQDEKAAKIIRGALVSDYLEVSLVAARALGMLGSDAGYGVALKGMPSKDARQRFLAALAFGAIGRTDAQGVLGAMLAKDPDPDARLAAATAILQLR